MSSKLLVFRELVKFFTENAIILIALGVSRGGLELPVIDLVLVDWKSVVFFINIIRLMLNRFFI